MIVGPRLFVTGTDTGVGKSVVTAALAAALSQTGTHVRALKPVASGVAPGEPGEDASLLALADLGTAESAYRFAAPLSPHLAAELEGASVDLRFVLDWIAARTAEVTLVEGVGGFEVPLTPAARVSDLAERLGWPVLVVSRNRLGMLNHTLLTVEAVQRRGLTVAGVVLTPPEASDSSAVYNAAALAALLPQLSVRSMQWVAPWDRGSLVSAGAGLLAAQ